MEKMIEYEIAIRSILNVERDGTRKKKVGNPEAKTKRKRSEKREVVCIMWSSLFL
jgi:hypothetical protein